MTQTENSNSHRPKVSVIVPVYNVEKYIERCARSLFEQTLDDIEYIFVDDCSPDNSIGVLENTLKKYPHRANQVKIVHHSQNKGLAAARNSGLDASSGQYILNVDSDDWLEQNALEILYHTAVKDTADMVVFDFKVIYSKRKIAYKQDIPDNGKDYLKKMLLGKAKYSACNKLIRKSIFDNLSQKWIEGINMGEDMSVIPRVTFFSDKIAHVALPLYNYNQLNEVSYTHTWGSAAINNVKDASNLIINFINGLPEKKDFAESVKFFELNNTYEIVSHSPIKDIKKNLSLIRTPSISNIIDAYYPLYIKLAYILYVLNLPNTGKFVVSTVNRLKRLIGY